MIRSRTLLPLLLVAAACHGKPPAAATGDAAGALARRTLVLRDTTIRSTLEASGIAAPIREATLGTKLMGSVTEVLVHEGQTVAAGEILVRIDSRDVAAKSAQADAGVAEAEAMYKNALAQTTRIRALYADSAAPKAQLDEAEAGLARADAGLRAARGMSAEVEAVKTYADVRAPFAGSITKRFVDPGAFVAPGAPIVTIQDASRLRISVSVAPADVRAIVRGAKLGARIEEQPTAALVEGIVPGGGGALYTVNALVENTPRRFLPGAAATLLIPQGTHAGILLPESMLVREGDLTGTYVIGATGQSELRWLQVARAEGGSVEVLSGLRAGDRVESAAPVAGER